MQVSVLGNGWWNIISLIIINLYHYLLRYSDWQQKYVCNKLKHAVCFSTQSDIDLETQCITLKREVCQIPDWRRLTPFVHINKGMLS